MTQVIHIQVDDTVCTAVDDLFNSLGLDTATAVRIFLAAALEENGFPFPVKHDCSPNADLLEAINDTRERKNLQGPYVSAKEAIAAMLAD